MDKICCRLVVVVTFCKINFWLVMYCSEKLIILTPWA
uniref:Uncharacterized protein n=1 Tax=Arundo donax TaxID=35708 RepID=A0A0A8Y7E2_ARUDO